jgi:16S rRNA (uracil1498-N3)-methyltransferase
MHRFYCPSRNISAKRIVISDRQLLHHIRDVLRFKKDDEVGVFDNRGNEYTCLIREFPNNQAILEIKKSSLSKMHKIKVTVACAIPKKSKMDDIIDKLTQLGVDRIIPLKTSRVVVKLDRHKEMLRQARWKKIALNASQQSQRISLPIVEGIKDIKEVLSESGNFDLKLIPTLEGARKPLREIFSGYKPNNVLVLIGPEGDFSDEEVALARDAGCIPITLGEFVLRVDTAAIAVCACIKLSLGAPATRALE